MICRICHREVPDKNKFCGFCGDKLDKSDNINEKKANKSAVWALAFSIISVFGLGLFAYIGLVMGLMTLNQMKLSGNQDKKNFAIAAIIIGGFWGPVKSFVNALVLLGFE